MKATPDQVEYLKSRVKRHENEAEKFKRQMYELEMSVCILLKQLALEYGGEDHTLIIRNRSDINEWKDRVERDPLTGDLIIKLWKK